MRGGSCERALHSAICAMRGARARVHSRLQLEEPSVDEGEDGRVALDEEVRLVEVADDEGFGEGAAPVG